MKHPIYMSDVIVFINVCLIFFFSFIMSICAIDSEGDWALYKVDSTWHSNNPEDTVPQHLIDINQTEWKLEVEKVQGEIVRVSVTIYYLNGTKKHEIREGNIWTGSGNLSMWLIRNNLGEGDIIFEEKDLKVNSTRELEFAGAVRQIVYAWFKQKEADGNIWKYDLFWDKETGILCGELMTTVSTEGGYFSTAVIRMKIVETSLWEPSGGDFWFLGIAVTILVLVLVSVVFVYKHKKFGKRRKHACFICEENSTNFILNKRNRT